LYPQAVCLLYNFKRSQDMKSAWCKRRKVFLDSSRGKNVVRAQLKRRGRSARVAVHVIMTSWERGGRIKNLQGMYQDREKDLVMHKMPILTTSSLCSLKKSRRQRGLRLV
jgi:polysaccharide deacetylase 2 family uncharacterized protein YibQ